MSAINTSGTSVSSTDSTANPNSTLNQADFLQLLVTQMTSQDPLNPESDTDFAAQLAQFSSLQETTSMAGNISSLQAQSLIGLTVTASSSSNNGESTTGPVTGIDVSSGTPEVLVNGQLFGLNQITSITPTPAAATSSTASNAASTPVTKP